MSSHVLAEVERLATRIGIIHRGRLLQELEATEIEQLRARRLVVDAKDRAAAGAALAAAGYSAATDSETGAFVLREIRAVEAPDQVACVLVAAGAPPIHLAVEQEDLEEYFLRLTGADQ